jgi:hypothetical protein
METPLVDLSALLNLLNRGGVIALLAFNVWAVYKGWVVPRWVHDELKGTLDAEREDKEKWRTTAMSSNENTDRALIMLEQLRSERSSRA